MKKIYLFLFSMLFLASFGWGQVSETFSNIGPYSGYQTETWTGDDGGTWTATDARTDQTINGKAITVRNGLLTSPTHSGGIGSLTVTTQRKFSGGTGNMDVKVNGSLVGTIPYDGTQQTTTISNINISGSVTVVIDATNSSSDRVAFDDLSWTAYSGGGGNDTDAEAYTTGSQPAGASISSLDDTYAERVDVFNMYIGEAGTADGLPTHVTNVRIKPHSSNTADWTDHIQGAVLNDGSSDITATVDITDTYIDFAIVTGNLDIADGDFEELTLSIYLNTSGIVENSVLSFMVDADDHGFTADASGTGFMSTFSGGDFYSNDFTLNVEASKLSYLVQPSNVNVDAVMSPDVQVAFTDANGNVDTDYNGDGYGISLTTTGTFSGAATTAVDPSNGISTFDNIQFSATGSGVTITANDEDGWGIPSLESSVFNVTDAPKLFISEVADPKDQYKGRFVELYNAGSNAIDFDTETWYLSRQANGSGWADIQLEGVIYPGCTYVCAGYAADFITNYGFDYELASGSITGNGDDGYYLYSGGNHTTGNLVDAYGVIDQDGSGKPWDYEDSQAKRNSSVTTANDTWTASEWTITANSVVADMDPGTHSDCISWSGATSHTWATSSNWSGGSLPDATKNVKIPLGTSNYPTIAGASNCNNLYMRSSDTEDASLLGQSNLTLAGSATIERYISPYSGSSDGWHFLSSPVNNMTIAGSDFVSGTYDLYYWAENEASVNRWYNYEGGSFPDASFENGTGYLFADAAGGVFEFSGDLNSSTVTKNLSYNADKGEGWNLIGNPFTSALDADAITFTGAVNTGVYVVNPADGSYMAYNGGVGYDALADGHIPVNQGFFVEATGAGASVSMETADQVHSTNDFNKNSQSMPNESMMVTLSGENSDSYTFLGFRNDASMAFDGNYDAYELFGWATIAQVYTELEDVQYSINCLPHSEETITVPLCISVQSDEQLSLNFSGMETFFNTVKIELEDKQLGFTQNIANNPTYTFEASAQDNPNRFLLHFNGVTGVEDVAHQNNIQVYSVDDIIYINSLEDLSADILVYNINGQLVYNGQMNGESLKRVSLGTSSGVYLVNIVSEETSSTHKVYVK